ncbi:hypothetical protein GLOTRDRAFT_36051 [Gloeophyllum trabeum ATCC 11539]|uniref:RNA-dependent RNA polymerase n=1 Tax=Gloeophyllum trabeum (strain ATCC 11539 / FP-39264 / Madison 617) TaxID=670483 RepID=S7QEP6_GLOTA|nr:uncharacterized protein GLOTRDRAFT_36051 [Gloeophyllum trabeum ATCC 11539]EPQ58296.1 hypothetical protein GLOTRDRAFT_36051 [Gloeophyllum trabeum ATCC 11539]
MPYQSPWKELDREVETLRNNPSGCLGVDVGGGEGNDGWYGGKIHFTGKMREDGHIVLQRPELGPSCRFTRKYGSASLVRIKVPQKLVGDKLREYCKRPFVILGRVFRAFYEKDLTVFLMQTDEVLSSDQNSVLIQKSDGRSISHFINWHNPIFQNREQTMAKWAARQALALSNSVPGVLFKKENIFDIPDESDEMIMTDGCGFVNRTVLNTLRKRHGWHTTPTAIQGRLAGAKGLFLVHPTDDDPEPKAWIRPSQVKIKYTEEQMSDPALRTLDVLRASHMKTPGRLSAEIIINLSHNGVRPKVFIELMAAGLEERVRALTDWEGPDGPFNVWCAVASAGNVFNARAAREAAGEARVNGYRDKDDDDADDDDDEELIDIEVAVNGRSSAWWADHISGCPSSLEETCMVLIDAGFTPDTCWVLQAKLREVIKSKIKTYVSKYNFEVFMSCTAFIVPDPVGVLEAGEIQILCSDRVMKPSDGSDELTNVIIGDVVVGRNPCKLPTDVQKVRAVQKDELREYRDVIVFSTKGDRSLASKLGGGDYDGDKVLAIWQPEITNSFQNADPKFLDPAAEVKEWISKDPTTVSDILEGSTRTSLDHFIRGQQDFLLMGLRTLPLVGIYSTMHDYAAYMKGYDAEETVALAHMSCIVLDGTKTGLTVKSEVYARHENLYRKGKRAPFWREEQKKDTEKEKLIPANEAHPKRPEALQNFVMDRILDASRQERDKWLRYLDEHMPEPAFTDKDLEEPLRDARRRAQNRMEKGCHDLHDDLQLIEHHVERIWRERPTRGNSEKSGNKEGGASFTGLGIEQRQDKLRELSRKFVTELTAEDMYLIGKWELEELKASCAYSIAPRNRFPFDVATRHLCAIKARSLGPYKVVTQNFYERFRIHKSFAQRYGRS